MVSTKAAVETQFAKQFRELIKAEKSDTLRKLREEAFAYFETEGFPTPKQEDWKYTNVAPLAKVSWTPSLFHLGPSLAGEHEEILGAFDFRKNGFTALNFAFGHFSAVSVPKETCLEEPIIMEFAVAIGLMNSPHSVIIAEPGSKATIVEP